MNTFNHDKLINSVDQINWADWNPRLDDQAKIKRP